MNVFGQLKEISWLAETTAGELSPVVKFMFFVLKIYCDYWLRASQL